MPSSNSQRIHASVARKLQEQGFSPVKAGDDFEKICQAYTLAATQTPRRDLLLQGACGCGKTMAARILSQTRNGQLDFIDCANPRHVRWLDLKDTYTVNSIITRGFVLDDWGAEKPVSEYGVLCQPVADFICVYYSSYCKIGPQTPFPSIVTTNLSANDISERFGQRVTSRLAELFVVCKLNGGDHRQPIVVQ